MFFFSFRRHILHVQDRELDQREVSMQSVSFLCLATFFFNWLVNWTNVESNSFDWITMNWIVINFICTAFSKGFVVILALYKCNWIELKFPAQRFWSCNKTKSVNNGIEGSYIVSRCASVHVLWRGNLQDGSRVFLLCINGKRPFKVMIIIRHL